MTSNQVYINADTVTMDTDQPEAKAFWVNGSNFLAVGSENKVRRLAPADARIIDLEGKAVVPGFIETHNHLSYFSLTLLMVDCSPFANQGIEDVKEKIHDRAKDSGPGQWVIGWGFDDTLAEEQRHMNRSDLDQAAGDNPVLVSHASGHLAYTNSMALHIGGVTRDTPQPQGAEIHKDERGEPTGLLLEPAAIYLVANHLPKPDVSVLKATLPEAIGRYHQTGITSVHDGAVGMMGQGSATLQAYHQLEAEGRLKLRVYLTTMYDMYDGLLEVGLGRGFGSNYLRLGAVKMFQDGSIQGLTGALSQDYYNRPGHRGQFIMPQGELDDLVAKYHQKGLQIAVHANGDAAIESVIAAIERAHKIHPQADLRHMIIHCQTASDDHIERMARIGIVPSYFVNHVYYWGDRHESLFLGPQRAARIDPLGSSIKAGLRFTLHADTPVTPVAPLFSIHCAVNRMTRNGKVLGAGECVSPYDALKAYSTDAAYCSYEEDLKGSITAGKLADFTVLSENPLKAAPGKIKDIQVIETVVGGESVYHAN
jgi:predicted amidohydrolase YtcJ